MGSYIQKAVFCFSLVTFFLPLEASSGTLRPRVGSKSKQDHLAALRSHADNQNWSAVNTEIMQGFKKGRLTLNDLNAIAESTPESLLARAIQGTKKILSFKEKTGLDFKTLFPIALYAESVLANPKSGKQVVSAKKGGRELQYDPKTHSFFIHLGTNGVKPLGVGRKKVVTRTIKYDNEHPEMMARGVTTCNMKKEMAAMKALRGLPGLLNAESLMVHKEPKSKDKTYTFITKIFNAGSLQDVFDTKSIKLSLKEKLQVATDIISGIASMHSSGYVHRDLGARNYFVEIHGKGKGRKVHAVVADMGRTIPASTCDGDAIQGNSSYISPEGFFRNKMKGSAYYQSDLFAVGCVMWQLLHDAPPAWRGVRSYKDEKLSLKDRYKQHLALIEKSRSKMKTRSGKNSVKGRFASLALKMTDPNPAKRGTAVQLQREFEALLKAV